jgi:signal transduction histidine kinase
MIVPPLPPDEPRRLQALYRLCLLDTPAEMRFDRIVRTAARVFRVPIALVSLVDGDRQWFKARVGLKASSTPRSVSFCGHAILTPDTFVVQNALDDRRFFDNPLVTGAPYVRFYAGHPVRAADGNAVGTLCLIDREAREFPQEQRQLLADMAAWVELEFNALMVQEARKALAQKEQLEAERRMVEQIKNEFVSTVSHELRTPLTSIRGALGLLSGGVAGPLPSEAADMIGIAHKNSERLIRLINDMLDLEKAESGKLDFQLAPVELGPLMGQAAVTHQGYARERRVKLEVVVEAPGAQALVDEGRFLQVLANLISNALKFSPEGEQVVLRLARHGGRLRMSVEDRGPGIPEAFRARIFQKFAQADGSDTRRRGGTGLGLAISHAFMERMGGTLEFTSSEGAGATFWAELPEWYAAVAR